MTDITLEQRARELLERWRGWTDQYDTANEAIADCIDELEAALRLSAGADVSRLLAAWYEQGIRQGMRVQSPGHAHERPGIWDDDNGKLAGVECAACALWKIAAQIAAAPRHEPGEGS